MIQNTGLVLLWSAFYILFNLTGIQLNSCITAKENSEEKKKLKFLLFPTHLDTDSRKSTTIS